MTEKDEEKRRKKECKRVKEMVDLKTRYLNSARLAMSMHCIHAQTYTRIHTCVGNIDMVRSVCFVLLYLALACKAKMKCVCVYVC